MSRPRSMTMPITFGPAAVADAAVGWANRSVPTIDDRVGTLRFAHPTGLRFNLNNRVSNTAP